MTPEVTAARLLRDPVLLLAFGFGSGLARKAPGTFGTLAAVPLYLLLSLFSLPVYLAAVLVVTLAGIWICGRASQKLGTHDHPGIVWDEIAGFLVAMIPGGGWTGVVAGFVLFRLFDIWKPWPIGFLDRKVGGGFGVMLDDLAAGVAAAAGVFALAQVVR